jgi:hypothetical protein
MLTNVDPLPAEGNFCENKSPVKPHIVARYNPHMGYINNSYCMANSYSVCQCSYKRNTKLFSHLLDLTVLNSWILLSSCEAKYTHQDFRLLLVRNLSEEAGRSQDQPTPNLVGRPSAAETNVTRLEIRHSKHWPVKSSKLCCRLVQPVASARPHHIGTQNVVLVCAWHLVSQTITRKLICVNGVYVYVCGDTTVIKGATNLLQQPELCE